MLLNDQFSRVTVCSWQFTQKCGHLQWKKIRHQYSITAPNDFDTYIRRVTIIQRDEAISGLSTQFDALLVIGQLYDFQNCLVGWRLFWKVIAATISRCQVRQEFQFGDFCLHRRCLCGINKYSVRNIQKQINQLNNEKLER